MQNAMFVGLVIWKMSISKLECLEVKGNKLALNCLHTRKVVGGNSRIQCVYVLHFNDFWHAV